MIYIILIAAIATLVGVGWLLGKERLRKLATILGILTLRFIAWLKVQLLAMPSRARRAEAWVREKVIRPTAAAARKATASRTAQPETAAAGHAHRAHQCWLRELPGNIITGWRLIFLRIQWYTVGHRAERLGILPFFRFLAACVGGIASVAIALVFIAAALAVITTLVMTVTYLAYRGTPPDIMAEWLRVFRK